MVYAIVRFILSILCKALFFLRSYGRENLPTRGGFILASNHISFLDPIVLGIVSPRPLYFMAKEELFRNKYFGKLLLKINVFPTSRTGRDVPSIRQAIQRLKEDKPLLLFPEGTRSPDGSIGEPKLGIGLLVCRTQVPVIPTFIKGSDNALPRHAAFIKLKPITVHFGKKVIFDRLAAPPSLKEEYRLISNMVMDEIVQLKKATME